MAIEFLVDETQENIKDINKILEHVNKPHTDKNALILKKFIDEIFNYMEQQKKLAKLKQQTIQQLPKKTIQVSTPPIQQKLEQVLPEIPAYKDFTPSANIQLPKPKIMQDSENSYTIFKTSTNTQLVKAAIINEQYNLVEPSLTNIDEQLIKKIQPSSILKDEDYFNLIKKASNQFRTDFSNEYYEKIKYYLIRNIQYEKINALLQDKNIKNIKCDGPNTPLEITWRDKELNTNILYDTKDELNNFIKKLAFISNASISEEEPLLDTFLLTGHRLQATLGLDILTPKFLITK